MTKLLKDENCPDDHKRYAVENVFTLVLIIKCKLIQIFDMHILKCRKIHLYATLFEGV